MIDELDLRLLHALQLAPRLSWSRLQDVLEVDASTLSRRWKRLSSEGLAWVFMHPSDQWSRELFAYVEVDCQPGTRAAVADAVAQDPPAWSVEFTTGRRELVVAVGARTIRDLDRYVERRIAATSGVVSVRTHVVRKTYRDQSMWRLNALTIPQQRVLTADSESVDSPFAEPTAFDLQLLRALACDGRRSASSIAAELDKSESTVTRGITRMLGSLKGHMRCDMAQTIAGWPYVATLLISVPQSLMVSLARGLAAMPTTRGCYSIAGPSNLLCVLWMRSLEELDTVEERIGQHWPDAHIDDRWLVTHFSKRRGHLLSEAGRRIDCVVPEFAVVE